MLKPKEIEKNLNIQSIVKIIDKNISDLEEIQPYYAKPFHHTLKNRDIHSYEAELDHTEDLVNMISEALVSYEDSKYQYETCHNSVLGSQLPS